MKSLVAAAVVVVASMVLALGAPATAHAQDSYTPQAPAIVYGGPFYGISDDVLDAGFAEEVLSANARAFLAANVSPGAAAATGTTGATGTGGGLAVTGSEAGTLAAFGLGAILIGGGATVIARGRRD